MATPPAPRGKPASDRRARRDRRATAEPAPAPAPTTPARPRRMAAPRAVAPARSAVAESATTPPTFVAPFAAPLLAPEATVAEMAPLPAATAEPAIVSAPPEEIAPDTEARGEVVAAEVAEVREETGEEASEEISEEPSEPEPAPMRKMPTLAVMAALAQRADPDDVDTAPRLRAVRPTAPLEADERLDPRALEALEQQAPEASTAPLHLDTLDEPDVRLTTEAPANDASADTASAPTEEPNERPASKGNEDSAHRMWWPAALRRRAAPETRPIAATPRSALRSAVRSAVRTAPLDDAETTAPRPVARRTASAAAELTTQPHASEPSDVVARRAAQQSRAMSAGPALAASGQFSRRAQVTGARLRARAMRSPRVVVLSWTAGGHVAVACVAAMIAVIAALRSSAGPDALAVFNWALALALIAGAGAAVGYACAQTRRPRLATLALILSQMGALAWALALLGPRAALLMLAPASAALALRGAGRLSAIATALGWLALFIAAVGLNLAGQLTPALPLGSAAAALVDVALALVGLWLAVSILNSLYLSRLNVVARGRAVEHAALLTEAQLDRLRTQTEDDADALRRTLRQALRGEQPDRVYARGALSVVADEVNTVTDRLTDLGYDRVERKRLESATRRLTRVIERAWLGLPWSWPDATGTLLDDLLALLRMPPPADLPDLLDDTTPTGQVVAPHLFRNWQATDSDLTAQRTQPGLPGAATTPSAPGYPSLPSMPSYPSMPSLWPSDPGAGLIDPLELPPAPRWRGPDTPAPDPADHTGAPDR
ncbi:MAG TPA: hypothetical protein VHI51_16995 [Ktedonobacterales bacterium]|nr:hypothetical protein [Ktedonobacterales bacterium]